MDRKTFFVWLGVILVIVYLLVRFSEPTAEVLLGFELTRNESAEDVEFVLSTLEQYDATATFFVTGRFANANPELVEEIALHHEIACNSMTHPRLPELNESLLRRELEECKGLLENLTGEAVVGFRAPDNLIDERTFALLEVLGYEYDATIFEHYGWFYPKPSVREIRVSTLVFIPMSDGLLAKTLHFGDFGYFLLRRDLDERVSLALRPSVIARHKGAFQYLMYSYADDGVEFKAHRDVMGE